MPKQGRWGTSSRARRVLAAVGVVGVLAVAAPSAAETFTAVTAVLAGDDTTLVQDGAAATVVGKQLGRGPGGPAARGGDLAGAPTSTTGAPLGKTAGAPALKALPTTSLGDAGVSALRGQRRTSSGNANVAPSTTAPTTTAAPTTTKTPTTTAKTPPQPTGVIVRITDHGAIADDDRADDGAIAKAIAATPAGGTVVFPAGTYLHTGTIDVRRNDITLWGYGATLEGTTPSAHAIVLEGDRTNVYGFRLVNHTTTRMDAAEQDGIAIYETDGSIVRDNTIEGASAAGILITNSSNYQVLNNTISKSLADGIHSTGGSHHGLVAGNVLTDVGDDCFAVVSYIDGNAPLHHITIRDNSCTRGKARGISVVGGEDILITNNTITASAAAGVYLTSEPNYNTYAAKRVQVIGNTLIGVNTNRAINHGAVFVWARGGSAGVPGGGSTSLQNEDLLIKANTIRDTVAGDGHIVAQGPYSRRVNIADNVLVGSKGATRIDLSGGDYNLVRNSYNGKAMSEHVGDAANLP